MNVGLTATYDQVWWDNDEQEDPNEEGGFTDPLNPWGGFKHELPCHLSGDAFKAWVADHVKVVECNPWEAAQTVVDFPGGVWDRNECDSEQDVRTGRWTSVTLHVPTEHQELVFALADVIEGLSR